MIETLTQSIYPKFALKLLECTLPACQNKSTQGGVRTQPHIRPWGATLKRILFAGETRDPFFSNSVQTFFEEFLFRHAQTVYKLYDLLQECLI